MRAYFGNQSFVWDTNCHNDCSQTNAKYCKEKMSNFVLVNSVKVNDEIPVEKIVSVETGMQVYIARVDSPQTDAYLALGLF